VSNRQDSLKRQSRAGDDLWHGDERILVGCSAFSPMKEAWSVTQGESNVVVAVFETGLELDSTIIKERHGPLFPLPGASDILRVLCSGSARSSNHLQDMIEIAPKCSFMSVHVPIYTPQDILAEIFHTVSAYADIVSCPWKNIIAHAPMSPLLKRTLGQSASLGGSRGKGCLFCFHWRDLPLSGLTWGLGPPECKPADQEDIPQRSFENERTYIGCTTPLVASVAALVISAHPALPASEVIEIILSTAKKHRITEFGVTSGAAPGTYNAGQWMQYVNAAAAVSEAIRRRS
jgi:hypothetical protein